MRADRLDMWSALADEASALATDYAAALVVDADHASPSIAMRMSALRGQTRGLIWNQLPYAAWNAGKAFTWAAAQFAGEDVTPAQRLERGPALIEAAKQLAEVLAEPTGRRRADLDD
jgi:hypothetical protein